MWYANINALLRKVVSLVGVNKQVDVHIITKGGGGSSDNHDEKRN